MEELQVQLESVLDALSEQIIQFFEQDLFDAANSLMAQYSKLAPNTVERYSLEAMLRAGGNDWARAEEVLQEGLSFHPLSFDLLYNLGYVFQNQGNLFETYNMYMKARYVAETDAEKTDIATALKGLVDDFQGGVSLQGNQISAVLIVGEHTMNVTFDVDDLLKRKEILGLIEETIDKNSSPVLEIGFMDGIISKNLNYFGYDVTAVDRNKERMLGVMALEWHESILQPEQKVAKFYYEQVNLTWMQQIPEFDVIVAVAKNNFAMFDLEEGQTSEVLKSLLKKANNQLYVSAAKSPSLTEFSKDELITIATELGYKVQVLGYVDAEEEVELCLINKQDNIVPFKIPIAGEVRHSKSTVFEIEVDKCIDVYGAGYKDDYHHFVETLNQFGENPELEYTDSFLKEHYDRWRPKNTEEVLFVQKGRSPKLNKGWIGPPWFWNREQKVIFDASPGETRPGGNHFFGPNTDEFGEAELKRLIPLYVLFKEQGYHPELFADGYISGYLMLKGDDYRFVVTEGQHRMAAIAALGYEKIRCRFSNQPQYPHVVLWEDVKKWPQVVNGVYSRNLALKIFERFFAKGIGKERMKQK